MQYSSQNKVIKLRIGKVQVPIVTKPPFLALIERNFAQSKINATFKFPRNQNTLEDSDDDTQEMQSVGVYNLNNQNLIRPSKRINIGTMEVRQPQRIQRIISTKSKEMNLSAYRIKTEITEDDKPLYKLPQITNTHGKKRQLESAHLRSVSQTMLT